MKRAVVSLVLVVVTVMLVLLLRQPVVLRVDELPRHRVDISNGEQMFHAGGCASCHAAADALTAPVILGGGLEMDTPFGTFRVPNISPDPVNGIGGWTMIEFVNAMVRGVSPDGRHYYPAFPYTSYARMKLEDIMDIKGYLDTMPATGKPSEAHTLNFPWNIRAGIGFWKLVNAGSGNIVPVPGGDEQLSRGRYLVEGPGHCGECHTRRNLTGGLETSHWLGGAANPDGEGKIPNITPHENGLAAWTAGDIEYYLESGFTPDFDTVGGSMVKVQENMARLSAGDRAAIAAYLKTVPALN